MRALGINGSPKKEGNTYLAIKTVMDILKADGLETEIFHIGGRPVSGCTDCKKCLKNRNGECAINDHINEAIKKAAASDILLIGSPVYFSNVSTEVKAFIDRAGRVGRANDFLFKNKIGAAIAVARRAGKTSVISQINYFFLVEQMIIPGSTYWNGLVGRDPGDVLSDKEGLQNLKVLAQNISWLARKLRTDVDRPK